MPNLRRHTAFLPCTPLSTRSFAPTSLCSRICRPSIPRVASLRMTSTDATSTDSVPSPTAGSSGGPSAEANDPAAESELNASTAASDAIDSADLPQPAVPDTPMDYSLGTETTVLTVPDGAVMTDTDSPWLKSLLASREPLSTQNPLAALRAQANDNISSLKVPTRKMEPWRFTDLRSVYASRYVQQAPSAEKLTGFDFRKYVADSAGAVLVFVDGVFHEELSQLGDDSAIEWEGTGGYFGSVGGYKGDSAELRRLFSEEELGTGTEGGLFPTVAHAIGTDAGVIHVPDGFAVERPVAVLFVSTAGETQQRASASAARLAILMGKGSKLTLLESHVSIDSESSYSLTLGVTAVRVGEGAKVSHYVVNDLCEDSHLLGHVRAEVHSDGSYECRSIGLGSKVGRWNVGIDLIGHGSHGGVFGSLLSYGYQVLDIHSRICHNALQTTSEQLQKNVAADHGRTVFKGKILVTENGAGTDSSQLCRSLLLSRRATVDAMPVLEVANDDVKCTHGATVSNLEGDQLFYCQSRGLTYEQAQHLLITGFALDVIKDCPFPTLRTRIGEKADALAQQVSKLDRPFDEFSSI